MLELSSALCDFSMLWFQYYFFTRAMLASVGISCCHVSVCPSVTSWCSTEVTKRRIMQTKPHDSPGILGFWCRKSWQNANRVTPNEGAKCRWGKLNAGEVAENRRLSMRSIVNLAQSQVYYTNSPWCSALCGFVSNRWSLSDMFRDTFLYSLCCSALSICLHIHFHFHQQMWGCTR